MEVKLLDSSALVKRYTEERGSSWVTQVLDAAGRDDMLYIAAVTPVEVVAAIARRRKRGDLNPSQVQASIDRFRDEDVTRLHVVSISDTLIASAVSLADFHALRGYDAIQLAAALRVAGISGARNISFTLISADDELNAAARDQGLSVENPNDHA